MENERENFEFDPVANAVGDIADIGNTAPSDSELKTIAALAAEQLVVEGQIRELTRALSDALKSHRQISEVELPTAMQNAGCSEFTLTNGQRVNIEDKYIAKQLSDPDGLEWVEENNGASLIKTVITVELDRGDVEKAREIVADLKQHKYANQFSKINLEEYVHHSTMGAFVRELIQNGYDVPLDRLGVRHEMRTIVGKRPKWVRELAGIKE